MMAATGPTFEHSALPFLHPATAAAAEPVVHLAPPGLRFGVYWPSAGTVVLTTWGEVDLLTAPQLTEALGDCLRGRPERLVLDLSEVDFLAAAGLSVLVRVDRQAQQGGTRLHIVTGDGGPVVRTLSASGLDQYLPLSASVAAACR
jgi:anti-anti-sigma factor